MGKIAFVFAGQGAQYPGMGKSLCEASEKVKELTDGKEIVKSGNYDEVYFESFKNENVASKSPLLGLLNYNFDTTENISTDMLIYTNMMSSSEMNEIGINSIYKGKYGLTKTEYIQSSRYVSNPQTNCYYYQNDLKQPGFNCNSICAKSDAAIRNDITNLLQWPNILPDDIDTSLSVLVPPHKTTIFIYYTSYPITSNVALVISN